MRKTAHLFTGLLAALVLTACGGNNGQPIAERDTVSVSGEGTIKARPDI
ncbi:MAG TPA: enolase, partial [Alcanivorax sp.]|nr:enolase [Alcanivorax sp.]